MSETAETLPPDLSPVEAAELLRRIALEPADTDADAALLWRCAKPLIVLLSEATAGELAETVC